MDENEDIIDCILSIDETLSEAEEALEEKKYSLALSKIKEVRSEIDALRENDEKEDDRQEVDMHIARKLM